MSKKKNFNFKHVRNVYDRSRHIQSVQGIRVQLALKILQKTVNDRCYKLWVYESSRSMSRIFLNNIAHTVGLYTDLRRVKKTSTYLS